MFLAFDGNLVGRRLELYLLDNREEDLKCFSQNVSAAIDTLGTIIKRKGGEILICAGDNILARMLSAALLHFVLLHNHAVGEVHGHWATPIN
jgi:hypothetical protein